ncbi:hypothetical protein [Mycolicibacterium mageritense]|uniref:hypothetical protein n=1 Tax=Mycolicibacterium mageritense TaxID=53462 RepID=UPI0011D7BEA3|nr:hypothetical protein [Mycolicibacterium mageritense]TXI55764.1 MAG: hypothetical protein E6Q55_30610 [Mycolicibacterium mageritense]
MIDEPEDLQERYDLFQQLDHAVSAYGPDDVTVDMAKRLLAVLKTLGSERSSATAIDLAARAQRRVDSPTWEATWERFRREIREERIRVGRELGFEPESDTE